MKWMHLGIAAVLGLMPVVGLAQGGAQGIATAKAFAASGQYREAVQETDRVMRTEGDALSDEQIYELTLIKAESLLQMKNRAQAIRQFRLAAQVAPTPEAWMAARANVVILTRTQGSVFTPRAGVPERDGIDIMAPDSRKKAMLAMANDMRAEVLRQKERAMEANTLPAVEQAYVPLIDLYALEAAGGGETQQAQVAIKELSDHLFRMLQDELVRVNRAVRRIDRTASTFDNFSTGGLRGLGTRERNELGEADDYLARIENRLVVYRQASRRLAGEQERWNELLGAAADIRGDIESIMSFQY